MSVPVNKGSAVVVGAGIVGLAMARALAVRGYAVTVLERHQRAVGASVRNFGSIWPIGVGNGVLYERAMHSRRIWCDVLGEMHAWHEPCGSLHVAHHPDEMQALLQYADLNHGVRPCRILDAGAARSLVPVLSPNGLQGALFCADELLLDPREAIRGLPKYLEEKYGVRFLWEVAVNHVESGVVYAGRNRFAADHIYVCGGADFEWLYPEIFAESGITRCQLQMMRFSPHSPGFRLGPAVATGLSLVHYAGFAAVPEVAQVRARLERDRPELLGLGIHMLVMQNGRNEITVGDSHAYGHTHEPFNEQSINAVILGYLARLMQLPPTDLLQTWLGVYAKLTDGRTELVISPCEGVTLVNGLGGLGMTLSFGLAEELADGRYRPKLLGGTTMSRAQSPEK